MRAVVVEDAPELRDSIVAALGSLGYTVDDADSVWTFDMGVRRIATRPPPDLLLIDVMIPSEHPDMDGADLAKVARLTVPSAAIVVCSGVLRGDSSAAGRARSAGAVFLEKPIGVRLLEVAIAEAGILAAKWSPDEGTAARLDAYRAAVAGCHGR